MMSKKESLQQIEDFYINLWYKEKSLRKILSTDKEYQKLLKNKKENLSKKFKINQSEKKKYVLATDTDYEILAKCKKLEKLKLTEEDRILVKLIKYQLEDQWRKPLLKTLNTILKNKSNK